ncbi:hypothetical protein [Alphaentomopoxvirus acuprea]|uniref:Uncharacterized protein n=1 Tax=Alphaentomopoxvirus acuprea TaxID=62099 RepID=W6JIN6_9POXV|nr:hypothetical protein BA82_gp078 [Anomala cuprea entomopoxvirus]BAO49438.1 hypothetical protein [Anomala cuprea entomopoxvirus]
MDTNNIEIIQSNKFIDEKIGLKNITDEEYAYALHCFYNDIKINDTSKDYEIAVQLHLSINT